MRVDTLRSIDRFFGVPACLALTLVRWLARRASGKRPLPPPRKILIIKLSEMGSTVLACPALLEIKRRCPEAELYFLVFKSNAAIIEVLGLLPVENIVTVDYRTLGRLLISGMQAVRRLLRENIDCTIDMDLFSRLTALLGFFVCRGSRVGFDRYNDEGLYRGNLLTHRVLYSPQVHTSAAFMALVKCLFERTDDEPYYRGRIDPEELILPKYAPTPADIKSVQEKLEDAGIKRTGEIMILINPNSSEIFPLRKWPLANFALLCQRLVSEIPGCWLVFTGVASEREDAEYIMTRVQDPRCVDFTGQTTFRELMALYSLATLMVSNDSGPAHFASLLRLPTVVLFGPETPHLYGPIGKQSRILYAHFACSPCVSVYNGKKSSCEDNRCLKVITVDEVLREIHSLLRAPPRKDHVA